MLKDLMDRDRAAREYGLPRELGNPPSAPQAIQPMPTTRPLIQPLPPIEDVEDFMPDDFVTNAVRSPEVERLTGQDALEEWASQTEAIRQGKTIPAIRRPSNRALREMRCPNCQCEFSAEVDS